MGENTTGLRYWCKVRPDAVTYLLDKMGGQRVSAERAGVALKPVAGRLSLPYTYGDNLRFSDQYVLIAAVALGQATVVKEERSYVYSIR